MISAQSAVFFLEEDSSVPEHSKPLMLEAVLFCPILTWVSKQLLADGVQRFFVVCGPRFAGEARACFPDGADVTVSEQHGELMDFLNTPDTVAVFTRAALPAAEAIQPMAKAPAILITKVFTGKPEPEPRGTLLIR